MKKWPEETEKAYKIFRKEYEKGKMPPKKKEDMEDHQILAFRKFQDKQRKRRAVDPNYKTAASVPRKKMGPSLGAILIRQKMPGLLLGAYKKIAKQFLAAKGTLSPA